MNEKKPNQSQFTEHTKPWVKMNYTRDGGQVLDLGVVSDKGNGR